LKIEQIETFAVRIPRDHNRARGGAGSPGALHASTARYARAVHFGTVYARDFETCLVKITTTSGIVGWGEAQAPVVPEAVQEIIDLLLAPLLLNWEFDTPGEVRDLLYNAMRVRGHFGGFYIDALSAVDIALWDIAGKQAARPVYDLVGTEGKTSLPLYISGLTGTTETEQIASFERYIADGVKAIKVFMAEEPAQLISLLRSLRKLSSTTVCMVDALWRLNLEDAMEFARMVADFDAFWLEAPLVSEDVHGHQKLAAASPVRIAIGESYRTRYEIAPFFETHAMHVLQPDIGRCGITEGMHLSTMAASAGLRIAPHISIGMGPQIAAALHCAANWKHLDYVECNPQIYAIAGQFQSVVFKMSASTITVPDLPGLGIALHEEELSNFSRVRRASLSNFINV
jgi:galactonate dehydratase